MSRPAIGSNHSAVFSSLLDKEPDTEFAAGDILFNECSAADHALYLVSGRVAIEMAIAGNRRVQVATRGAFDLIGEMGLVSGTRFCQVRALEPVRAVRIGYPLLTQMVNARSDFAISLYTLATVRLEEACRLAADQAALLAILEPSMSWTLDAQTQRRRHFSSD